MPQNKQKRDAHFGGNGLVPGSPGYRTRGGRSGLDPIDSSAEAARVEGDFLVRVFKLRARTRNPFYLVAMVVFGIVPFPALAALVVKATVNMTKTHELSHIVLLLFFYLTFGVIAAFTGALSLNFVLSILEILKIIPPLRRNSNVSSMHPKKKQPKRRKDYR